MGYPWAHSLAVWDWASPVSAQNPDLACVCGTGVLLKVGVRSEGWDPVRGWASCLATASMVVKASVSYFSSISDQAATHGGTRKQQPEELWRL